VQEIIILKFHDVDAGRTHGRYFGEFKVPRESAHGRYAAVSAGNPGEYASYLFVDYLLPERGIVAERSAAHPFYHYLD